MPPPPAVLVAVELAKVLEAAEHAKLVAGAHVDLDGAGVRVRHVGGIGVSVETLEVIAGVQPVRTLGAQRIERRLRVDV